MAERHNIPEVIIHIPHSNQEVPINVRGQFLLEDGDLQQEILKMTDCYTDELFSIPSEVCQPVIFPVSRLVVDPERFIDDKKEIMSKKGMGVIYTKTSDQKQLRKPISDEGRQSLLDRYYHPHHKKLSDLVQKSLNSRGKALIIDAHSFPSIPLPYELNQDNQRPDICIGTDSFHTPDCLSNKVYEIFDSLGYSVVLNRPFEGTFVPSDFYQKDPRVLSIMVEVNRCLYMDEASGKKNDKFNCIKNTIETVFEELLQFIRILS